MELLIQYHSCAQILQRTLTLLCCSALLCPALAALEELRNLNDSIVEYMPQANNSIIGHGGIDRTLANLKQLNQDWLSMKADVKRYIQTCPVCQKLNISKTSPKAYPFLTSS